MIRRVQWGRGESGDFDMAVLLLFLVKNCKMWQLKSNYRDILLQKRRENFNFARESESVRWKKALDFILRFGFAFFLLAWQ